MNTKIIREIKQKLSLTKRQRAILAGLVLGDGHLETQTRGRTYRLKVEHGVAQSDYVRWLHNEFKKWIPGGIYSRVRKMPSIGFTTYSHNVFRSYAKQFYDENGRKRMPIEIYKLLSPLTLAIWFMDDGSRKSAKHKTYVIHSLGYTRADLEIVQSALKQKLDISAVLHSQKGKSWRLYIPSNSAKRFEELIGKYVVKIPSMKHKRVTQMPKK